MSKRRYYQAEFETASRLDLQRLQWRLFGQQVERAIQSRFYAEKFRRANVSLERLKSLADVILLPVTRKPEVCDDLNENPPYGSRLTVPRSEIVNIVETSGTTVIGKEVYPATRKDLARIISMESAGLHWAGVEQGSSVALTVPVTMTAASTWWFLALQELGSNPLRVGHLGTREKLNYIARYGAEIILGTPTYINRLEYAAADMGLSIRRDLSSVRSLVVAGEAKSAAWARQREETWGATVYEQWGCTQGAVAWSCEAGMAPHGQPGTVHFLPHLALMEVVDPETGQHVMDGEFGELVITPLGVEASPLIRFATGDRARFVSGMRCSCGRPFDGIEAGSVSRYDDMIKVKGVNIWPSMVDGIIEAQPGVMEHRITAEADERGRETITLEVDLDSGMAAEQRKLVVDSLGDKLAAVTGLHFKVVYWAGAEPLAAEMLKGTWKAKRWRDLRA